MTYYYSTFSTPAGDFSLAVNEAGAIVATAFGDSAALLSRLAKAQASGEITLERDSWRTTEAREQIAAYFAGDRREFDLQLAPHGTLFQHRVWAALHAIPFGETRSYGDLARELKSSPRAVGRANATNPICLITPCHRVIGADGSLTGFAFGEEVKRQLLAHEESLRAVAA